MNRVVERCLLAAALLGVALMTAEECHGQAPPLVEQPSFDPPDESDPLEPSDGTDGGFEFTPPFDLSSPPNGDSATEFDAGSLSSDTLDGGSLSGPRRRPVPSSLEEPDDTDDVILQSGFGGPWHDGPVLAPNDCSKCLIGNCSGHYRWYGSLDYLMLNRDRPNGVGFSVTLNQTFQIFVNSLSTDNMPFASEPGVRATFGRCLGTDCKNRDHSFELTYLGINEWEERITSVAGDGALLLSAFLRASGATDITVFDNADRHDLQYSSDFNSIQLDYKIKRRLEKDRMVFRPEGTWHREAWPGLVPALYFGIRHVSVDEEFEFRSTTTGTTNANGLYAASTRNNLIGLHAGGEVFYQFWKGSVGVRGGAGALTNFMEVFGSLTSVSDANADDNFVVRRQEKDQDLGLVADFSVVGNYRLTKQLTMHIAYNFIWVGGVALAPEQFTFNVIEPIRTRRNGLSTFQGVSIGGEFVW